MVFQLGQTQGTTMEAEYLKKTEEEKIKMLWIQTMVSLREA